MPSKRKRQPRPLNYLAKGAKRYEQANMYLQDLVIRTDLKP